MDFGTSEDQILKEEDEKGTAEKKTGKPSSRIPTFQSSLARKRTTTQIAESPLPLKPEGSSRECQMKEKGIGSGETLRTKLPVFGDRETALPVLSTRIHSHSTDDLSVADMSDPIQSDTSDETSLPHEGNHSPEPNDSDVLEESLHRPSLREEIESHDMASASEPLEEPQDTSTEVQSKEKEESDTVLQDNLEQKLSAVIQDIGDELKETLEKEIPSSIMEDAQKQCSALKETKKLSVDVPQNKVSKQSEVSVRSKTDHSRQAEQKHSTSSMV